MIKASIDALVIGAGPGALAIAAALAKENLKIEALSENDPSIPWPFTYGIWGNEVDGLGLDHLLEHRWKNTVSFLGKGSKEKFSKENEATKHKIDYGLFDKLKLQNHWLKECELASVKWHKGHAKNLEVEDNHCTVTTSDGLQISSRLVIDATGYKPIFLRSDKTEPISVQTCYGIVASFNKPPVEEGQFVLMDYRSDHLSSEERKDPPSFLYAMDLGNGKFFLEETSLGLAPPMELEVLKKRLQQRLSYHNIKVKDIENEELGLYLPMNLPLPDLTQPVLGFGGSAAMVHPASGYMIGNLIRRAPDLAKVISEAMKDPSASPAVIANKGWNSLWPSEHRRKNALYKFGLEKLMRFTEEELRSFFKSFFGLPKESWYGFLTNTLSIEDLVQAMMKMFLNSSWNVRWALMRMEGRELYLLWRFLRPNI